MVGQSQKGKTNALKVILNTALLQETDRVAIFDSFDRALSNYASEEKVNYMETKEQITAWLEEAEQLFLKREEDYLGSIQHGMQAAKFSPVYLVIDGYSRFAQAVDSLMQERLAKFMKNYSHLGFNVIVSGSNNELTKGYDSFTSEIKQIRQALMFMKKSEQTLYTLPYDRKEAEIHPGYAYYVINGKDIKIQIPLCTTERKILT